MKFLKFSELPFISQMGPKSLKEIFSSKKTLAEQENATNSSPFRNSDGIKPNRFPSAQRITLAEYLSASFNIAIEHCKRNIQTAQSEFPLLALVRAFPKVPTSPERQKELDSQAPPNTIKVKTVNMPGDPWLATLLDNHEQRYERWLKDDLPKLFFAYEPPVPPKPENIDPPWHYKLPNILQHWVYLIGESTEKERSHVQMNDTIRREYFRKIHIPYEPLPARSPIKRWLIKKLGHGHLNRYRTIGAHELADWIQDVGQLYDPEREMYRAFATRRMTPKERIEEPIVEYFEAISTIHKETSQKIDEQNKEKIRQEQIAQYYVDQKAQSELKEKKKQEEAEEKLREEQEMERLLEESFADDPDTLENVPPDSLDDAMAESSEETPPKVPISEEVAQSEPVEDKVDTQKPDPTDWFAGEDDEDDMLAGTVCLYDVSLNSSKIFLSFLFFFGDFFFGDL